MDDIRGGEGLSKSKGERCQVAAQKKIPLVPQVRVLELENDLQKERQKLGELRKKHYELAGVAEGWEEGGPL